MDIVSASENDDKIAWHENNGAADPSFSATTISTSADGAYDVDVNDLDNDGDLDIISASRNDDKIAWYENNGAADPTFNFFIIDSSTDGAISVATADIDNDGFNDILAAGFEDDKIRWFENSTIGSGFLNSPTARTITTSTDGAKEVYAEVQAHSDLAAKTHASFIKARKEIGSWTNLSDSPYISQRNRALGI